MQYKLFIYKNAIEDFRFKSSNTENKDIFNFYLVAIILKWMKLFSVGF